MNTLKKALLVTLGVVLVGVLASAAVNKYDEHKANERAEQVSKEVKLNEALRVEKQKNAELLAKYQNERLNCEKGRASLSNVPAQVKKALKLQTPVCGPAIAQ